MPMLAEQLSQSAVEQRINNGYTGGCVEKTWGRGGGWLLFVRLTALSDVLKRFLFISNITFHLGEYFYYIYGHILRLWIGKYELLSIY